MKITSKVIFDCNQENWETYHKIIIKIIADDIEFYYIDGNVDFNFVAYMKGRDWDDRYKRILFKDKKDIPFLPWYVQDLSNLKNGGKISFKGKTDRRSVSFDGDGNMYVTESPEIIREGDNYYIKKGKIKIKCTESDIDQIGDALNNCMEQLISYNPADPDGKSERLSDIEKAITNHRKAIEELEQEKTMLMTPE